MLDDLERALEAAPSTRRRRWRTASGSSTARSPTRSRSEGLVEVAVEGVFDPHTQEALLSQPSPEPEGTVLQVIQKGYSLGDRVLRPARVVISAGRRSRWLRRSTRRWA